MQPYRPGTLVVIGGAEDKSGDRLILKEFARLAGGPEARIVVITVASQIPEEVGPQYREIFLELTDGQCRVDILGPQSREEAADQGLIDILREATGVFFTGGDQYRITSILGGTRVDACLHDLFETGLTLGGTSAGAAMMSSVMIIQGPIEMAPKVGMTEIGVGMDFLPGVIIDQHFAQRGRINRLLSAIGSYPHLLGVGIDENTALIVEGHECEVIGEGTVTFLDAREMGEKALFKEIDKGKSLAICDIRLHMIPAGFRFDLRNRKIMSSHKGRAQ